MMSFEHEIDPETKMHACLENRWELMQVRANICRGRFAQQSASASHLVNGLSIKRAAYQLPKEDYATWR
jgi:hypothetical protein